jgi:hypothetical protein
MKNASYENFSVKGDLILEGIRVGGNLSLRDASIEGFLDLDEMVLEKDLILQGAGFKSAEAENIIIRGKTIN